MQKFLITFSLLLLSMAGYSTWSIIVIDPRTGEIGIAGASCTYSVYGIGGIVPGKGAIVVQAMSNKSAKAKGLEMIASGASPGEILQALKAGRYEPEEQQYGIVCLASANEPINYTGSETYTHKGGLVARGISVQGNTLSDSTALQAILNAALKAQSDSLPIAEVLMAALEAGARQGGDKRCGEQKASSAFITVAKPKDEEQKPWLNLVVKGEAEGVNAVEALRKKYDSWKRQ
ncbi:MAG TPA: DUF1028 domain-containing protein [Flavisolibacter sp.]|nr:DUF1028 domain-containing protein [Flavisolibacter sp.]